MSLILSGNMYHKMVQGGAAFLNRNRETINDLNVFPIPDGDTGDNMHMTISAGAAVCPETYELGSVAGLVEKAMLLGARGNSGVILSRIFSGFSKGFVGLECANYEALRMATEISVAESYSAVDTPVDGTILSVYRDAVSVANAKLNEDSSLDSYFDDFIAEAKESLERTPEQLPVLKEAGVVDSGAAGLICIFEGMKAALSGDIESDDDFSESKKKNDIDLSLFDENTELKFGYCTEFLLRLQAKKVGCLDEFDENVIKSYLANNGESLVFFRDGSIIKVHVHTFKPGEIINECQKYGEFLTMKIENMSLQHSQKENNAKYEAPKMRKKYAVVTVAAGDGVKKLFKEINADYVIDGGQSMNPSSSDFIEAYRSVNAETIFVFPNNSNIILSAKQSAELYKESEIVVVESKTIGEGYVGIGSIDTTLGSKEEILEGIISGMDSVITASVSRASRDTMQDGITIHKDHYIGFVDKKIYVDSEDKNDCAYALLSALNAGRKDLVIMISGVDAGCDESEQLYNKISSEFKRTEIINVIGNQPVFDYVFIIE